MVLMYEMYMYGFNDSLVFDDVLMLIYYSDMVDKYEMKIFFVFFYVKFI